MGIRADVAKRTDVLSLFATIEKEFGRLDILVNNAGMFFPAKFEELTEEQWGHNSRRKPQVAVSMFADCRADASPQRSGPDR